MNHATLGIVLLAALVPVPGGTATAQDPDDRVDVAILAFKPGGKVDPEVARAADRCAARTTHPGRPRPLLRPRPARVASCAGRPT